MKSAVAVVAFATVLLLAAACGGGDETAATPGGREPDPAQTATPPASPAAAATLAAATPAEGPYELVQALPSATFDLMLGFSTIPGPGNDAVIVTQDGVVWRVPLGGGSPPELFADLTDRLVNRRFEEGLLGLAFSPDFESDGRVYLYYAMGSPGPSVLSRFLVANGALDTASERVLLEVPQPMDLHNGGQLAFGPDGYLYLSLGDGGDPQGSGQDLSTLLGSILRLDVSGSGYAVPPDNPFVGTPGAKGEIYAYGLRNPWRFSFDRATGDMWAADAGQDRWEEVDHIIAGRNYGWNVVEGFECFSPPENCPTGGLELPRAVYGSDGGCSVIGGFGYRGASMPELDGWYVYGDLCSGKIWAVNTADSSEPVLLADTQFTIVSFGELPDGELLVVTFNNAVFRLQRSP